MSKETRLFVRLALIGVGIVAILIGLFGNPAEQGAGLAWFALP